MRAVLHVDVDAFFCQVEENRRGGQDVRPVAIQQHQDIIAVNYPGRALGVVKHMRPAEAWSLAMSDHDEFKARGRLARWGGTVLQVHSECGGRISYGPYRAASKVMLELLQGVEAASNVEKASIDEAFLELRAYQAGSGAPLDASSARQTAELVAGSLNTARSTSYSNIPTDSKAANDNSIRNSTAEAQPLAGPAVRRELGLKASVGIAPNKLLAKLASGRAKPDGIAEVSSPLQIAELLRTTPAARMPGFGGSAAEIFAGAAIASMADLQEWSAKDLRVSLGFSAEVAAKLVRWSCGQDDAVVAPRAPPKSLSVQMSITPQTRPRHPAAVAAGVAVGGEDADAGVLQPLVVGAAEYGRRTAELLSAMASDLLGRIELDRQDEGRWPTQLQLQLRFMGPGVNSDRLWARTTAFPAPTLAHAPAFPAAPLLQFAGQLSSLGPSAANGCKPTSESFPRSDRTAGAIPTAAARSSSPAVIQNSESAAAESFLKEHSRSGAAVGAPPGDALEAAVRANVMALCRTCSVQHPPSARLVEARVVASAFSRAAAAAGPSMRAFLTTAATVATRPPGPVESSETRPCSERSAGAPDAEPVRSLVCSDSENLCDAACVYRSSAASAAAEAAVHGPHHCPSHEGITFLPHAPAASPAVSAARAQLNKPDSPLTTDGADIDFKDIDVGQQRQILRQLSAAHAASATSTSGRSGSKRRTGSSAISIAHQQRRQRSSSQIHSDKGRQPSIAEAFKRTQ